MEIEKEIQKEVEYWNKLKRIEKIKLLKRKWAEEKAEVITEQFSREEQQHPEIIFPENDVVNNVPLSVLQRDDVVNDQFHQDVKSGFPAAEVCMEEIVGSSELEYDVIHDGRKFEHEVIHEESVENKQSDYIIHEHFRTRLRSKVFTLEKILT